MFYFLFAYEDESDLCLKSNTQTSLKKKKVNEANVFQSRKWGENVPVYLPACFYLVRVIPCGRTRSCPWKGFMAGEVDQGIRVESSICCQEP